MIITTTDGVEDKKITAYLGIVSGEAIMGTNFMKDLFAGFRDVFGGRSKAYEKELRTGRDEALKEMTEAALALGADAIVAVDLDYQVIGGDEKTLLMICVNGTAVKLG